MTPLAPRALSILLLVFLLSMAGGALTLATPPSPSSLFPNAGLLPYPAPSHLPSTVYQVAYEGRPVEEQLLLTTLAGALARQGLNASSSSSISLLYKTTGNSSDPTAVYWRWYREHFPSVRFNDSLATAPWLDILGAVQSSVKGFFLCDLRPPVPGREADSVNVAVSLAGITPGAIAVTPTHSQALVQLHIAQLQDVRALNESTFLRQFAPLNASTEAQPWPFSRHFISSQTPTKAAQFLSDWSMLAGAVQLHHIPTALQVMEAVPQGQLFAWLGWTADDWSENGMTGIVSQAGGVVWAADTQNNLATHAFLLGDSPLHPTSSPRVDNAGKHTVAFLFTDGDSLVADTAGLVDATHWTNPRRGSFPMTWGVNPSLAHLAPGALEFFYDTATANDGFAAFAPGYAYPSFMTEEQRWLWAEAAGETMNQAGLRIDYLIDFNFSAEIYGPLLHQWSVDGLVLFNYPLYYLLPNNQNGSVYFLDSKPAIFVRESLWAGHSTPASVAALLNAQVRDASRTEGYSVVAVHLWSQTVDTVGQVVKALDSDGVVVVQLDELVRLMTERVEESNRVVAHVHPRKEEHRSAAAAPLSSE